MELELTMGRIRVHRPQSRTQSPDILSKGKPDCFSIMLRHTSDDSCTAHISNENTSVCRKSHPCVLASIERMENFNFI